MREKTRLPAAAVVLTQLAQLPPSCPCAKQLCQWQTAPYNPTRHLYCWDPCFICTLPVQAPNTITAYMLELPQHILTLLFLILLGIISFALGPCNARLGSLQRIVESLWHSHAFCSVGCGHVCWLLAAEHHAWTALKPL